MLVSLSLTVQLSSLLDVLVRCPAGKQSSRHQKCAFNVRQHLLQDDVSAIFCIDVDTRLQEVDISAPKTRHPDRDHHQYSD